MYTQHWQGILYGKQRIVPELNKAEGRKKSITNATSCSVPPKKRASASKMVKHYN
jgi:hypothetical protein